MDPEDELKVRNFLEFIGPCIRCGKPMIVSVVVLTNDGPYSASFCINHLTGASEALELLMQGTISGEFPVEKFKMEKG